MAKFIKVKGWRSEKDVIDVHLNVEHIVMVHKQHDSTRIGLSLSASDHPQAEHADGALHVEHTVDEVMALIDNATNGVELPSPLTCIPKIGHEYYLADVTNSDKCIKMTYTNDAVCRYWFKLGLLFGNRDDAVLATNKMLALLIMQ